MVVIWGGKSWRKSTNPWLGRKTFATKRIVLWCCPWKIISKVIPASMLWRWASSLALCTKRAHNQAQSVEQQRRQDSRTWSNRTFLEGSWDWRPAARESYPPCGTHLVQIKSQYVVMVYCCWARVNNKTYPHTASTIGCVLLYCTSSRPRFRRRCLHLRGSAAHL